MADPQHYPDELWGIEDPPTQFSFGLLAIFLVIYFRCTISQRNTPWNFVSKWTREKQTYQELFIDLCHLIGHQTPNDYDPTSTRASHC
jgi:hypothetical protein